MERARATPDTTLAVPSKTANVAIIIHGGERSHDRRAVGMYIHGNGQDSWQRSRGCRSGLTRSWLVSPCGDALPLECTGQSHTSTAIKRDIRLQYYLRHLVKYPSHFEFLDFGHSQVDSGLAVFFAERQALRSYEGDVGDTEETEKGTQIGFLMIEEGR